MQQPLRVAYFTMEIGLQSDMPTFAGGLGILAADLMRSAADLHVPAACVTMCWQHGYLRQSIKSDGSQQYSDIEWNPSTLLERVRERVTVEVEGRPVTVGAWLLKLRSGGHVVPVYLLDTNLPENDPAIRDITNHLYGGDGAMRLRQELVLGVGGVRMLRALGYGDIHTYHMNEGHAAFLTLELLRERDFKDDAVRPSCAFTTHTPVAAGHDVFDYDLAWRIAGNNLPWHIKDLAGQDRLSMTQLAIRLSAVTLAVSRVHADVSRQMFPGEDIGFITNGVHAEHWTSPPMQRLFDACIPGWRQDQTLLAKHARELPDEELWHAHQEAKKVLIDLVNTHAEHAFDVDTLTIAGARRVVAYKRPELLYTNLKRLRDIGRGRLQIIHAGNAHPSDPFAIEVIRRMVERSKELKDCVRIMYLPNYNPDLARILVAGADVWLNTPMRRHEASGTSGMKACCNGVLNLSTLDGWWIEAYEKDPEAGWRIGPLAQALGPDDTRTLDAEDLYTQLQYQVIPEYEYVNRVRWLRRMKRSIALVGTFNTHRCIREYVRKAWGG